MNCFKKKPNDIPATPNSVYKSDWISFPDWIGTKPGFNGKFLSFQEAKTFAKSLNISKRIEWIEYYKENKKDLYNIPYKPERKYKAEWKGWADFLGKKD